MRTVLSPALCRWLLATKKLPVLKFTGPSRFVEGTSAALPATRILHGDGPGVMATPWPPVAGPKIGGRLEHGWFKCLKSRCHVIRFVFSQIAQPLRFGPPPDR